MTHGLLCQEPLPIRLVFKLERAEHPCLYDELIRFHKGVKRVNRLRVLAYDGLLVQRGMLVQDGRATPVAALDGTAGDEGAAVTNELFAPAVDA